MARQKQFRPRHGFAVWVLAGMAASLALAVGTAPDLPDPGKTALSVEQQEQLGLKVAAQVYQQMPVLPDSSAETQYIRRLGKRLVATIPPEHSWPFEFHVIAQKEINAFALPGGEMFVNVGTIRAADDEAELAGVMAHEMSHVYMQHSAKQQEKASRVGGLAGIVGAIAGATLGGDWGSLAQTGIQFGAGTLMLKYSRGDEAQADAVGAIILWKAGYNPEALADFFEKIEKEGGQGPQFLSDHPNPGNRRAAIQKEIAEWATPKGAPPSADFEAARAHAGGVAAYSGQEIADGAKSGRWMKENQKNGATFSGSVGAGVPGGEVASSSGAGGSGSSVNPSAVANVPFTQVKPSSVFKQSDLGVLKIARPKNWEVMQDQQTSVTIAPKAGVSGGAVAYGAVIELVQTQDSNMSAQEMTAALVKGFEKNDSNTKQHGEIREITVNGMAAGSVEMVTVSPMPDEAGKPQAEHDWLVSIPRGGGKAVALVFVSTEKHFERIKPTFDKMLRSVQF